MEIGPNGEEVVDESAWELTEAESNEANREYRTARGGDHLVTTFQCDLCQFRNIKARNPHEGNHQDDWLLVCIRRANLDAFWSRRPSTVDGNAREIARSLKICATFGIDSPVQDVRRGPFPLKDIQGMGVAVTMLHRSLDEGRNSRTVQFDTVRGLRSAYSNFVHTTVYGTGAATLTDGRSKSIFTHCPTFGLWFSRFCQGCHERMGDVRVQDQALSIDEALELQDVLEEAWARAVLDDDPHARFEVASIGVASLGGYAAALRGEELGHERLNDTMRHTAQGLQHRRKPHVLLALQGRFKGVHGYRKHKIPLACVTNSGIRVARWVLRLLSVYRDAGLTEGPLLRPSLAEDTPARIRDLDVWFHKYLKQVQARRPDLISADLEVATRYSVRRSLRRGATSQARAKQIPEDVIYANNRWRKQDASRNRHAPGNIMENYTDVLVAIELLLLFSEKL